MIVKNKMHNNNKIKIQNNDKIEEEVNQELEKVSSEFSDSLHALSDLIEIDNSESLEEPIINNDLSQNNPVLANKELMIWHLNMLNRINNLHDIDSEKKAKEFISSFEKRKHFPEELMVYLLNLQRRIANYIAEDVSYKKTAKGIVLWGLLDFYIKLRPLTNIFIKQLAKEASDITSKPIEEIEYSEVKKTVNKAHDAGYSEILKRIKQLDKNIKDLHTRIKLQLNKHQRKINKLIKINKKLLQEEEVKISPNKKDLLETFKFKNILLKNFEYTCDKLREQQKAKKNVISDKDLDKMEEIINAMKISSNSKEFFNLFKKYVYQVNNTIQNVIADMKTNDKPVKNYKETIKLLEKSLSRAIVSYNIYRPVAIKYRIYKKLDKTLYEFASQLLLFKILLTEISGILHEKIVSRILSPLKKIGTKQKALKILLSFASGVTKSFLISHKKKLDKKFFQHAEEIIFQYKNFNKKLRIISKNTSKNIEKIQKQIEEKKYHPSHKQLTKISLVKDEFLQKIFKENKSSLIKSFDELENNLILNEKTDWLKKDIKKLRVKIDELDNLDDFIGNKGMEVVKDIYSLAKKIEHKEDDFYTLSPKSIKIFITEWNNCLGRADAISRHVDMELNKKRKLIINAIVDKLSRGVENKYKKISDTLKKDIEFIKKGIKTLPPDLNKAVDSLIDNIGNPKLRKLLQITNKMTKATIFLGVTANAVMAPVLKAVMPVAGFKLGSLGGEIIGASIDSTIPVVGTAGVGQKAGGTIGGVFGNLAFSQGLNLYLAGNKFLSSYIGAEKYYKKIDNKITKWIEGHFKRKSKVALANPAMNELRDKSIATALVIEEEILNVLETQYKDKDIHKIKQAWKKIRNGLEGDSPLKFGKAISNMNSYLEKINQYIDDKIDDKDIVQNSKNIQQFSSNFKNPEEVRLKLILTTGELYKASEKFKQDNNVKKLVKSGIFPQKYMVRLKKLERNLLYLTCSINYLLVPLAKYTLPFAMGIGGAIGGGIAGASADAALSGASLGLISLAGTAIGGVLGNLIGKVTTGAYGRVDKRFRKKLDILERELAFYSANTIEPKNKVKSLPKEKNIKFKKLLAKKPKLINKQLIEKYGTKTAQKLKKSLLKSKFQPKTQ